MNDLSNMQPMNKRHSPTDLRDLVRSKAEKHREYYRSLVPESSAGDQEVAQGVSCQVPSLTENLCYTETGDGCNRQRRTGVYETPTETKFQSVKALRMKYMENLCQLNVPPASGYSSSSASAGSDDERDKTWYRNSVQRSASSDSAVGLTQSDEEILCSELASLNSSSVYSPYSPRGSIDHYNVPTKTIIEAQCVPLPLDRKCSDVSDFDYEKGGSRRQSTFTDDGEDHHRYRYWRTPSVVVSDYSDDVMGFTLEDIEYFRNQRKERSSSPDSSLHSSCSNLNYVGSSISTLDAEYIRCQPFRKSSDCSTCSTVSGDEGDLDSCQYKRKVCPYCGDFHLFKDWR